MEVDRESHGKRRLALTNLVPQETSRSKSAEFVTAEAKQANEHDAKQDDVGNKRDDHGQFCGLDVERLAETARNPCIAELSEGLAREV